jgi:uncharacterized membrane protein
MFETFIFLRNLLLCEGRGNATSFTSVILPLLLPVGVRTIFKLILNRIGALTGLIWHRTGTNDRLLCIR